ncbi:MAG: alanine racemase [Phyllobacterium sp.]
MTPLPYTPNADPRLAGGRLTVDLDALVSNWLLLHEKSRPARAAAVVKANAYGLGIEQVVPPLHAAGCRQFFVALPEEGLRIRALGLDCDIYVLNGLFAEACAAFDEYGLTPVLGSVEEVALWREHARSLGKTLSFAVHVDTGMNRLGLNLGEIEALARSCEADAAIKPVLLLSHLSCADTPDSPKNLRHLESFQKARAILGKIDSSLANSPGIFLGHDFTFDLSRPGIAIYGGEAVNDVPNPMKPVVTLEARIVQVRNATKGDVAGYGGAARLFRDTRIAICSVGYADGYHRSSSGAGVPLRETVATGGQGFIAGKRVPILGRVTMDLTSFDITDLPEGTVRAGDFIELIGPDISLDDAVRAAGTIGYELLTSLGHRYHRRYIYSGKQY